MSANKKIMIFAPHPDDEILMCAGIIKRALNNGDSVKVVIVTNGDCGATDQTYGKDRIGHSIAACTFLGLTKEDILFLGYGDTGDTIHESFLRKMYYAKTDDEIVHSHIGTQTYGIPGYAPDFHSLRFGTPGDYNRKTIRTDIETVIKDFMPYEIYVTSLYDAHYDHSATYLFTVDAIVSIKRQNTAFSPVLYEGIIHSFNGDSNWPKAEYDPAPISPFTMPNDLEDVSPLRWAVAMKFNVPDDMLVVPRQNNKKYQAILKYLLNSNDFLKRFAKSDEFFWKKDFSNLALISTVTVSSENSYTGQFGANAANGIVGGYPFYPEKEWSTQGELNGAWIKLSWDYPCTVERIVLYDRPNSDDHIQAATLTFSDGSSIIHFLFDPSKCNKRLIYTMYLTNALL